MRILLTGGSGDLGRLLARDLKKQGDTPVIFDLRPPPENHEFIKGSITNPADVEKAMGGIDMVVHIAALHGIHEQTHSAEDFEKVNVEGTRNVLNAMIKAGIKKHVFISSTSIFSGKGPYARSKIINEKDVAEHAEKHGIATLTLRPRAFIPPWNRTVYTKYSDWAKWFWGGAVHADDVNQATLKAINHIKNRQEPMLPVPALTVDGAYDYTTEEISLWDKDGPGSTFRKTYGSDNEKLAQNFGLDPAKKPKVLDITETKGLLGYKPTFSLKNLLDELKRFGDKGPAGPFMPPPGSATIGPKP